MNALDMHKEFNRLFTATETEEEEEHSLEDCDCGDDPRGGDGKDD